jgi:predicted dehydrogenase
VLPMVLSSPALKGWMEPTTIIVIVVTTLRCEKHRTFDIQRCTRRIVHRTVLFVGQVSSAERSLRFANGALGTFMLSDTAAVPRSWEQTTQEDASFAAYPDEDCYVVAGTHGSMAIPTMRLKTYANTLERSWSKPFQSETVKVQRADPLARQLENFCAVIRGEAVPVVTARDGLQNLRVIDAIKQAGRTGAVVSLV